MANRIRLYLVEDNPDHAELLTRGLLGSPSHQFSIEPFVDGTRALAALRDRSRPRPDCVLLDCKIPHLDGLSVLRLLRERAPEIPVIMMTAFARVEDAVQAIKEGAFDYLVKPTERPTNILLSLEKALRHRTLLEENIFLRRQLGKRSAKRLIVGKSAQMREILEMVERIAPTQSTILITGESGTGKEVLAQHIHDLSPRRESRFVALNCSAVPEGLFESELFGHTKGSFTGAVANKIGLLKEADGGSFFLDEVAEIPPTMQVKLLRFLQDQEVRPTGSVKSESVNVRFIAATNRELASEVSSGRFREDLFYRLNVIHIHLPPLRERRQDIARLVEEFVSQFNASEGRRVNGIEPEALDLLQQMDWPGNIRQLKNTIERALIFTGDGEPIRQRTLRFLQSPEPRPRSALDPKGRLLPFSKARTRALGEFTGDYLRTLLAQHQGHVTRAAKAAGLGRQSFHRLLKLHQVRAEDYR